MPPSIHPCFSATGLDLVRSEADGLSDDVARMTDDQQEALGRATNRLRVKASVRGRLILDPERCPLAMSWQTTSSWVVRAAKAIDLSAPNTAW